MSNATFHLLTAQKADLQTDEENVQLLHYKPTDWKAPLIILAFELLESVAFFGVGINLVIYLTNVLHESNSGGATHAATWSGTCYLMPLLGAFICDSMLGSYKTTFFSALIYVIGMVIVTISASLPTATTQRVIFYVALYLIALGSGGMKSSMLPLGAGQFDDEDPCDLERKGFFFSCFYMCITIGALISGTVIVWIQGNVSWAVGYGIGALCIAMGLVGFLLGTPLFKKHQPSGSPLKSVAQVIVASFRKVRLKAPSDGSLLYGSDKEVEGGRRRLAHTQHFSFLDRAATPGPNDQLHISDHNDPWRLCTVTQVEELKLLLSTFPIWLTSAIYTVSYAQLSTTIIEQGNAMDTTLLSLSVPPAFISAVEVLFVVFWTTFHENAIVPLMRRRTGNPRGLTLLQRIGVGRALMVLAMAAVAFTEHVRLEGIKVNGERLSIAWQLPVCFLIGGSEAMSYIGQLEFFYEETPEGMKGVGTALYLMSIAAGNYLSSVVVRVVQVATSRGGSKGWIPEDLDEGHLDYFFWGLSGLCAINFVAHVVASRDYTFKKVACQI